MPEPRIAPFNPPQVTDELLQEITRRIVEHFDVEKIILFGSHAWGQPQRDSDVDLLVVMENAECPVDQAVAIHQVCRPRSLPMDVLVETPGELAHRLRIGDPFLRRVVERGRVLYER